MMIAARVFGAPSAPSAPSAPESRRICKKRDRAASSAPSLAESEELSSVPATWPHSDSGLRQYCADSSFHRIVALSRLKTLPGRATGSLSTGLFVSIRVVVLAEARTAEAPTGRWRSHCDSGPSAFCPAIPSGLRRAGQTGTWSRQHSPAGRRRSADSLTPLANTRWLR